AGLQRIGAHLDDHRCSPFAKPDREATASMVASEWVSRAKCGAVYAAIPTIRPYRKDADMPATRFELGDITIHRVVEQEGPFFKPLEFFPALTPELLEENRGWMTDGGYLDRQNGGLMLCIQSYLVQTPHHNILIDSCVGNHKPLPERLSFWHMMNSDRFEKSLAATGVGVDQIDFVMCTHLHVDHVGWNTRLENGRWVPTFPKAKYVFADRELAYWTETAAKDPSAAPWITDSVLPIVAAKREEVVRSDHAF